MRDPIPDDGAALEAVYAAVADARDARAAATPDRFVALPYAWGGGGPFSPVMLHWAIGLPGVVIGALRRPNRNLLEAGQPPWPILVRDQRAAEAIAAAFNLGLDAAAMEAAPDLIDVLAAGSPGVTINRCP